jgi:hypothetical protein
MVRDYGKHQQNQHAKAARDHSRSILNFLNPRQGEEETKEAETETHRRRWPLLLLLSTVSTAAMARDYDKHKHQGEKKNDLAAARDHYGPIRRLFNLRLSQEMKIEGS